MKRLFAIILLLCLMTGIALADNTDVKSYDFSADYADKFLAEGEKPIITKNSYKSQDISIEIKLIRKYDSDIYVADIYVRSMENFQRAYPYDKWGVSDKKITELATKNNAVLAMTGDSSAYFEKGWVAGNGKIIRSTHNRIRDIFVVYKNGVMDAMRPDEIDQDKLKAEKKQIWHCFLFGPSLLNQNGKAYKEFHSNYDKIGSRNPRSAIGYYAPGHFCFVQVDGRKTQSKVDSAKTNKGITLQDLAAYMESIGCKEAYNLDGGQSSMLWFSHKKEIYSTAYKNGRPLGDIVLIKEVQ
ncbi:MAG: phosphodiester glycosidase family protein [Clostridia bacterium]|nr:phosphodiester glycosidase family protein [Clostridia bacterium]